MITTKLIAEYVVEEYNKVGDISSTIENNEQYTITRPKAPVKHQPQQQMNFTQCYSRWKWVHM